TRDDQALVVADDGESALALRRGGRLAGLRPLGACAREPAALASEVRWSLAALGGAPATVVVGGADAGPALVRALAAATGARVVPRGRDGPLGGAARALGACAACAPPRPGRARRRARQRPPPRPRGELRRGRCAPPRARRLAAPGRRHRRRDPDHGRRPRGRVPAARGAEGGPGSELVKRLAAWLATLSAGERTL